MKAIPAVLEAVAAGLDVAAKGSDDTGTKAVFAGSAAVIRLLSAILAGRTTEEAMAILERIRDHGAAPISADDLAAQVAAVKAHGNG